MVEMAPSHFRMPMRVTTKAAKPGDREGECQYASHEEWQQMVDAGDIAVKMVQNPAAEKPSYSGYRSSDLLNDGSSGRVPLLFVSVFDVVQVSAMAAFERAVFVHVRVDDATEGLRRRGGAEDAIQRRIQLNSAVEGYFYRPDIAALVDVEFTHSYEDARKDASHLYAAVMG